MIEALGQEKVGGPNKLHPEQSEGGVCSPGSFRQNKKLAAEKIVCRVGKLRHTCTSILGCLFHDTIKMHLAKMGWP